MRIKIENIHPQILRYLSIYPIKLTTIQQVIIGDYDERTEENLEKEIDVQKVVVHQSYIHIERYDYFEIGSFTKGLISKTLFFFVIDRKRHSTSGAC